MYPPEKRYSCLSPQKVKLFVPQKRIAVCPPKRCSCLSFEEEELFVNQKGVLQKNIDVCPSKRYSCLSNKKVKLFVPQKGVAVCSSERCSCLFLFVVQKDKLFQKFATPCLLQDSFSMTLRYFAPTPCKLVHKALDCVYKIDQNNKVQKIKYPFVHPAKRNKCVLLKALNFLSQIYGVYLPLLLINDLLACSQHPYT